MTRILFVAMVDSVHTARWIDQVVGKGFEVHVFPSTAARPHPALNGAVLHYTRPVVRRCAQLAASSVRRMGSRRWWWLLPLARLCDRSLWLSHTIRRVRPHIVHSLEIQHAGYQVLAARERFKGRFPTWIVTNWGSDIFLFGRLTAHAPRIRAVLAACDLYSCECHRDVALARSMGFRGQVLPVLPNAGGFELSQAMQLRQPGPSSLRRVILVKGYQHWAGRALVALRALELCSDLLSGYRIVVYSASPGVEIAAELLAVSTGVPVDLIGPCSHEAMLRWYGCARVYLGLSISDAISTSLLEAIVMGAFPIQSCTACADEWVVNGETGMLVPPEDPAAIAVALRRALTDSALVDRAAERNEALARTRLERGTIAATVIDTYKKVAADSRTTRRSG